MARASISEIMSTAFVLIRTTPGSEHLVYQKLLEIEEISETHVLMANMI